MCRHRYRLEGGARKPQQRRHSAAGSVSRLLARTVGEAQPHLRMRMRSDSSSTGIAHVRASMQDGSHATLMHVLVTFCRQPFVRCGHEFLHLAGTRWHATAMYGLCPRSMDLHQQGRGHGPASAHRLHAMQRGGGEVMIMMMMLQLAAGHRLHDWWVSQLVRESAPPSALQLAVQA